MKKKSFFNLAKALVESEFFTKKCFGQTVNLKEMFDFSSISLNHNVIAAFIPAKADNRTCVTAMKKAREKGLDCWEEEGVNKYSNSQASDKPRLYLFERSERPNEGTMGFSSDYLVEKKMGNSFEWLHLGAYAIGMGTYHEATRNYLDSKTFTWFPKDRLFGASRVAAGYWHLDQTRVGFSWGLPVSSNPCGGARLAIEIPLKH